MRLDLKAILLALWLPALLWTLGVGGAALSGYPGVVCVTPLGWLLALNVGQRCAVYSTSPHDNTRLIESALAGALLGAFQGVLFAGVLYFGTPMGLPGSTPLDALGVALIALLAAGLGGALVTALLSALMALMILRRARP